MVRPSRRGRMRALLTSEESTGVADGDNKDWDEGGIFDPGTGSEDQWKQPVRVASTASVTVSTALNAGDTIDGVTLVAGDRVLLKDQSTASQNGIYVAGTTPARAADMDDDAEVMGALVYVIAGTANGGKAYKNTNTSVPTVGSTSLTFTEFGAGGTPTFATPAIVLGSSAASGAASTVIRSDSTIAAFDATPPTTQAFGDTATVGSAAFAARRDHKHAMPTAAVTTSGLTQATARLLGRTTASTGAIEEITVGTGLSLSAGSLTATGGGTTIITKDEGSTLSSSVTTLDFVGAGVTASGAGATTTITISGGGGSSSDYDPVTDTLGAPDTTFEFGSSSFTGLTALGSATTEDANTTVPGCYYVKLAASATYNWVGRYATPPSAPWTAVTKVVDNSAWASFNVAGLFVGTSTPGNMDVLSQGTQIRGLFLERATPTAFGSQIAATLSVALQSHAPMYFAIRVNSSSSVDYLMSWNGRVWRPFTLARNPSITIGSVGIAAKVENSTHSQAAAWEYLRIWNSAKTFPGV